MFCDQGRRVWCVVARRAWPIVYGHVVKPRHACEAGECPECALFPMRVSATQHAVLHICIIAFASIRDERHVYTIPHDSYVTEAHAVLCAPGLSASLLSLSRSIGTCVVYVRLRDICAPEYYCRLRGHSSLLAKINHARRIEDRNRAYICKLRIWRLRFSVAVPV